MGRKVYERYDKDEVWVLRDEYSYGKIIVTDDEEDVHESNRFSVLNNPREQF